MDYQTVFSILFILILTINYSLASPYLDETNGKKPRTKILFIHCSLLDISKYQSDENSLPNNQNRRLRSESTPNEPPPPPPPNSLNKTKSRSRFLTYDFLLHQWRLRKMGQ